MIILYLSLLILLYPSTTTFSVVGHAGTVSGMYFLWTGRFQIVFWSERLVIFSELLHCTFFLLRRPHILIGSAQKKYSCQGAAAMVYASKRSSRLQTFSLIITHSQQPFKWVHLWAQNLSFGFCLLFGILLTANIKALLLFWVTLSFPPPDDIRHPSCCWRGYLCIAQLVFWRKWGNLITIPIVSASHQSLFLSWPLDKKGRSDQVASKTRVALNKNGTFGILAHPCDH